MISQDRACGIEKTKFLNALLGGWPCGRLLRPLSVVRDHTPYAKLRPGSRRRLAERPVGLQQPLCCCASARHLGRLDRENSYREDTEMLQHSSRMLYHKPPIATQRKAA